MTTTASGTNLSQQQRIPAVRIAPDTSTVHEQLGLLADLTGTWQGSGFNLIARPDFHDKANTYLQLNQTRETLTITPVGSPVPNRGFGQDDIELFGLSYLQRIEDAATGGALHLEPGLWVTQPPTSYPPETPRPGEQIVFRLGSIPHGNSLLIQGMASAFTGPPTVETSTAQYAFSAFPSFNSTPFPATASPVLNAAGSSEKETATEAGVPPFTEYDLGIPSGLTNPRTPFDTDPADPALPTAINGVPMQEVVNDPASLLQAVIKGQAAAGCTFSGVALNISTQQRVMFFQKPNSKNGDPTTTVTLIDAGGSIGNIPFLDGGSPAGAEGSNAQTALVYATFWIEKVTPSKGAPFMQLQYAQATVLDFPVFAALHPASGNGTLVNIGWPHVSVARCARRSANRSAITTRGPRPGELARAAVHFPANSGQHGSFSTIAFRCMPLRIQCDSIAA